MSTTEATCNHTAKERFCCNLPDCKYCEVCGMGNHRDFLGRVKNYLDEELVIREGLWYEGPLLIERLTAHKSLRQLARETGFSPTYLSQVSSGKVILNERAFVRLSEHKS